MTALAGLLARFRPAPLLPAGTGEDDAPASGQATGLLDVIAGDAPTVPPRPGDGPTIPPAATHEALQAVLAEKVLRAFLLNRYQLLFPFEFDLRRLTPAKARLLVEAMTAAAAADGRRDERERRRIDGVIATIQDAAARRAAKEAAERPRPLFEVLEDARDVETGALVYAASLLAVDQRSAVNRRFLDYLSARLQLSPELAASLEQRFRSPG